MGGGEECPASGLFPSAPAGEVPANLIAANVATKQLALMCIGQWFPKLKIFHGMDVDVSGLRRIETNPWQFGTIVN